jgi:chemotaxis protein MotB
MSDDSPLEQIIIRKRRHDAEEDHHGGVWKLAFADFMTAMMAFFLVMWLINSTSKETKATIVQYFNPVKLIDSSPEKKGLRDPNKDGQGSAAQKAEISGHAAGGAELKKTDFESSLHEDPLKTLDTIARSDVSTDPLDEAKMMHTPAPSFRDPFDRMESSTLTANELESDVADPSRPTPTSEPMTKSAKDVATQRPNGTNGKGEGGTGDKATVALRTALEKVVREEMHGAREAPRVDVAKVNEGTLISLTDDANFSMFDVGSIQPKPQLVRILAQVGKILAKQPGEIEIRGHTDSRSYKTKSYDNWRLSSDRATIVNYMLVRGGLPDARVTKVSGFADRKLKLAKEPMAPANRRIEVLIKGENR